MLANGLDVGDTSGFGPKMAKALAAALDLALQTITKTGAGAAAPAATVGTPAATVKPVAPSLAYRAGYGPNAPADSTSVYKNPFLNPALTTPTYNNQFTFSQKYT